MGWPRLTGDRHLPRLSDGIQIDYKQVGRGSCLNAQPSPAQPSPAQPSPTHKIHSITNSTPPRQAFHWTEKAASQNYREAVMMLVHILEEDKAPEPSFRRNREILKKAVSLGLPDAVKKQQTVNMCIGRTLMDQRIVLFGLTGRHDMNGKRGVATDFHMVCLRVLGPEPWFSLTGHNPPMQVRSDPLKSKMTVRLDSGQAFKVPARNVQAERAEVGGKARGKGKKGRGKGK